MLATLKSVSEELRQKGRLKQVLSGLQHVLRLHLHMYDLLFLFLYIYSQNNMLQKHVLLFLLFLMHNAHLTC